jgi:SAM-dependent methyltransferase
MDLIPKLIQDGALQKAVFSVPSAGDSGISRVDIRPVVLENSYRYQAEERRGTQVTHKNLNPAECVSYMELAASVFKNAVLFTPDCDYYIMKSRKGKVNVLRKPASNIGPVEPEAHDRSKNYFFPDGKHEPFLAALDIMDTQGRVKPSRQKKFVQINRFIELMTNVLDVYGMDEPLEIVDYGCGKAYLTFAMEAFFRRVGREARITGVDLKSSVLDECAGVASRLGLGERISFIAGSIMDTRLPRTPNFVVALHACDTATDDAIVKAAAAGAKALLLAPCCQHELQYRLESAPLEPVLRYGVQRDKLATLVTDTLRSLMLESMGYAVDMPEFTGAEHTAKNVMIRAKAGGRRKQQAIEETQALMGAFGLGETYLLNAMAKMG